MRFILSAFAMVLLLCATATAGDEGLAGSWKLTLHQDGEQTPFWLFHIERTKDNTLTATADRIRTAPKVKVNEVKVVGDLLTMKIVATIPRQGGVQELQVSFEGKLPKPGGKKILGTVSFLNNVSPAILEMTTAKNPYELERDVLLRTPNDPKALFSILQLIEGAKENKVSEKDLLEWIDTSMKSAELYGPTMQMQHNFNLLEIVQGPKAYPAVAVETARRIGKGLDPKAPLDAQLKVFSLVADALRKSKAEEDAKAFEVRVEKLEGLAYVDYAKTALNFKIDKYAGRKAKTNRAVLVELFTGAQCPPCVASDMGFDGLEKTYATTEVVLLQYHLHIPQPDPMTNADADERFTFYGENYKKKVRGTPSILFNGKPEVSGGGGRDDAEENYKDFCGAINKLLEAPQTVTLSASAVRKGDKIAITAKVDGIDKPADHIRLRFVLVEDWVRFKGGNGLQYHHRVVRAMPGGAKGMALKEKSSEHSASVDLEALRKSLNKFLDEDYRDGLRPMRLRNLAVVAFVQDNDSTEVLQAVNVAVKDE